MNTSAHSNARAEGKTTFEFLWTDPVQAPRYHDRAAGRVVWPGETGALSPEPPNSQPT